MSTDLTAPTNAGGSGDKPPAGKPSAGAPAGGGRTGFFSLYKPGQGYWTRLGTAIGAAAIIVFIAWFTFEQTAVLLPDQGQRAVRFGIAAGVAALMALVAWWLMNSPKRAQFLIDTDSEMKKVNWAGWSELIGSTRIVIFFMVLTAVVLFTLDTQYHALFFGLRVWHVPFNGVMGQITGALLALTLLAIGFALWRGNRAEPTRRGKWATGIALLAGGAVLAAWIVYAVRFAATSA